MHRLVKTNITWAADVIDKLGWEAQRPLDPKNVETCRGLPMLDNKTLAMDLVAPGLSASRRTIVYRFLLFF